MPAGFFCFVFRGILAVGWQVGNGDSEGFGEVFGSGLEVEFFVRFPEVQDVSLNSANWIKTAEYLAFEIHRELPAGCRRRFMVILRKPDFAWYNAVSHWFACIRQAKGCPRTDL